MSTVCRARFGVVVRYLLRISPTAAIRFHVVVFSVVSTDLYWYIQSMVENPMQCDYVENIPIILKAGTPCPSSPNNEHSTKCDPRETK